MSHTGRRASLFFTFSLLTGRRTWLGKGKVPYASKLVEHVPIIRQNEFDVECRYRDIGVTLTTVGQQYATYTSRISPQLSILVNKLAYRGSRCLSILIHLCTSAISLAGSVVNPDRFPPQILRSKTIADVKSATYTYGVIQSGQRELRHAPKTVIEIDTNLVIDQDHLRSLVRDVQHVGA